MKRLTKAQALATFRQEWREHLANAPQWKGDANAKREAFNDYVDALNKSGLVTDSQAFNWTNPF
jgi:hypothetical protein